MGNCCHNLYFFQEDDPPANFDEIIEEYKRNHPKPEQSLSMDSIDSTEKDIKNKEEIKNKEKENKEKNKEKEIKEKTENPYLSEPGSVIQIFPPIRRQYCIQLKD